MKDVVYLRKKSKGAVEDSLHFKVLGVAIAAVLVFSLFAFNTPSSLPGNDLKRFNTAEEVAEYLEAQQSYGGYYNTGVVTRETMQVGAPGGAPAPTAADSQGEGSNVASGKSDDYSTTNVQVEGVDEADFVKNDGKYIYTITGSNVVITDAYPANGMKILSTINLSGSSPSQMYINGDRLVVFGTNYDYYTRPLPAEKPMPVEPDGGIGDSSSGSDVTSGMPVPGSDALEMIVEDGSESARIATVEEKMAAGIAIWPGPYSSTTYIKIYDLTDRANPVLKRDLQFNGSYQNSRMIGDKVYGILTVPTYGNEIPVFSPYQRGFPDIYYFDVPSYGYQYTNVVSLDVNDDTAETQNKVFMLGYATTVYVSEQNIYLVYQKQLGPYYTMEKTLDAMLPLLPSDVTAEINTIRVSDKSDFRKYGEMQLVLDEWMQNNPQQAADIQRQAQDKLEQVYVDIQKEQDKSVIHKIAISNGEINYIGNGEVPGMPLNQFSMDESNGYFRIATTTTNFAFWGRPMPMAEPIPVDIDGGIGSTPPSVGGGSSGSSGGSVGSVEPAEPVQKPAPDAPVASDVMPTPVKPEQIREPGSFNNIYVLDANMQVVGRLENLAPNERIFSARFIGDRAYMVTFERIDPLFVIDLSNPASPAVLGELKIPGVSDYLHPYDENHIIGVGRNTQDIDGRVTFDGLKISLFDVSNVASPQEVAKYELGGRGTYSEALYDHKAFLFSKDKQLLVLPVSLYEEKPTDMWGDFTWQGVYAFDINTDGITAKGRITHANNTDPWMNQVRRSLYIGEVLYTVSDGMIKANNLDGNLTQVSAVELPKSFYDGPYYAL